ncbi:zinc finger protein ubi-d4 isoform X2 [Aplysia californica]|uniref:Zinc finger protein ubi-d4 isoform X2 n=1 Tax=Aplysia californica TaxID=6500 RepID=A0ABM0JSU3_APLCA|nr:zinc finger protein ubi-d4 isoform X2 [Aplysia californica]
MASEESEGPGPVILHCYTNEQRYLEAMEQTASFNTRLSMERKMRLPFLDSQTGVAQRHTHLFHPYRHRQPGEMSGQLYSYPAKRWKKKKRSFFSSDPRIGRHGDIETGEADMHQISAVENPAHKIDENDFETVEGTEAWFDDYDDLGEPPDDGAMVDDQSDISDFEDSLKGKRRKKTTTKGRKKKNDEHSKELLTPEEKEKPYACEVGKKKEYIPKSSKRSRGEAATSNSKASKAAPASAESKVSANNYCDFCLGDVNENKKTKAAEELVSCSDCGRSGHPSCLQFTDNMIISVKKYPWQCIECKSCGLCGTSDNDDQLLFCDDCDRGYHMYCLNPPLSEPPEGSWSCHLCIEEFHGGKKPAGMN